MSTMQLLKRWGKMLCGKSTFHVKQGKGKFFSTTEVKGYYNDLTNKVSTNIILDKNGIPKNTTITGVEAYFPITIFQYGLGLYDLYLKSDNPSYLSRFLKIADWSLTNIKPNGMWNCMDQIHDKAHQSQSSMCQGEGASVLLRAYKQTKDKKYYNAAKKAIDFMLKSTADGGTTYYSDSNIIFQEYVSEYNLSVLNGWIFSIFGLYDFTLINHENHYKTILDQTINTLCKSLKNYDRGFWSNYDIVGTIASPAYHELHVSQLEVLYNLFHKSEFKSYATKWEACEKSSAHKILAICIKLKQKIYKNKYYDINTSLAK